MIFFQLVARHAHKKKETKNTKNPKQTKNKKTPQFYGVSRYMWKKARTKLSKRLERLLFFFCLQILFTLEQPDAAFTSAIRIS